MANLGEMTFRESVDLMFSKAAKLSNLEPGLEERIKTCNSTYTVRFSINIKGKIETFVGYRAGRALLIFGRPGGRFGD